jgi:hypothetical protein
MRRALMLPLIPLCAMQGGCLSVGGKAIVTPTPPACSSLLPDEWVKGVPSADLPNEGQTVGDWIKFGDAQTGQLDKANDHYVAGIGIIKRCEARDAAAVKKATKPKVLGLF